MYGWVDSAARDMQEDRLVNPTQAAIIRKAAQLCLAFKEQEYLDGLASRESYNDPVFASLHREYLTGVIEAARESLGKIIGSLADK